MIQDDTDAKGSRPRPGLVD